MPESLERLGTFPFGQPLVSSVPQAGEPRKCLLLGAYPSALHIGWSPPQGEGRSIKALAVDNEPEPFWNGSDESMRIQTWREAVAWSADLGEAATVGDLNGWTGRSVEERWLAPLGLDRSEVWFTDCLDSYHLSDDMAKAIEEVYTPSARARDLPVADLPQHPGTREIVQRAQIDRLRAELATAQPEILITLGNAALVMRKLTGTSGPTSLVPDADYGSELEAKLDGRSVRWYALVHPGQKREDWRNAHAAWIGRVGR
jgi:hypothetical protein